MQQLFRNISQMLQGGLIALHVAILKQEQFAGLILSSPSAETDPKVAGWFMVSLLCTDNDVDYQFSFCCLCTMIV